MQVSAASLARLSLIAILSAVCIASAGAGTAGVAAAGACPADDSGLKLPAGFCATVFADNIGHARHVAVSASGVVYVNTWSGRYYHGAAPPAGGFLVALRDSRGTGKADVAKRFGETLETGAAGGTGIALYKAWLYAEINDRIVRYRLPPGAMLPAGRPQTIVSGLPLGGDHPMHPFVIDAAGTLYVDVASVTNACQAKNRAQESPGLEPCVELATRGGIWRFDANQAGQVFSPGQRYATGIRNAEGIAVDAAGQRVFATQHGRDQLHANWPALYPPEEEATLPAEEVILLTEGGDYGWPECYYDPARKKLVLAPEYGGDGGKKVGACVQKSGPFAAFPAHWAPNDMVYYDQQGFPDRYRKGLFIAFHGSWDRAPYEQQGYNLVFQSVAGDTPGERCEIFADGFAGPQRTPEKAQHRPSGLAIGPDGALYVTDDEHGRIYRIVYTGAASAAAGTPRFTACPAAAAAAGEITALSMKSPAGRKPDVKLPVPPAATAQMVALGNRIYDGELGGAACTGCHGADGAGTPLGPNLSDAHWLWSDGSVEGIAAIIANGVAQPRQYRAAMPALGGAQLSPEQVSALAAYVWGLSHH